MPNSPPGATMKIYEKFPVRALSLENPEDIMRF
jgi:hypothetical protein